MSTRSPSIDGLIPKIHSAVLTEDGRSTVIRDLRYARLIVDDEVREAGLRLHISLHTACTQLKALYRKTGRRTQAALSAVAGRIAVSRAPHS